MQPRWAVLEADLIVTAKLIFLQLLAALTAHTKILTFLSVAVQVAKHDVEKHLRFDKLDNVAG